MDTAEKKPVNATEDTTTKSIQDGNKAIEMNRNVDNAPNAEEAKDKEKKDEQQWRNEG